MRYFIIVGHRAVTTSKMSLNDLPGSGGRMDIITRSINATFCISHDIRNDVEVAAVLLGPEDPPKTIRFIGEQLKYLNPDERSTGALIRNALVKYNSLKVKGKLSSYEPPQSGDYFKQNNERNNTGDGIKRDQPEFLKGEIRASPGIFISENGFSDVLKHYAARSKLVYLLETGTDISKSTFIGDHTFILSDHNNFTSEEEQLIQKHIPQKLSIGPLVLHTDHCIVLIHNVLDRLSN